MNLKEFKVIKTSHPYSNIDRGDKLAYAIVASTHLIAEPDSEPIVSLDKEDDMFIIANSIDVASQMLNLYITYNFGRKKE